MEKIKTILETVKQSIAVGILSFDNKITTLIPNPKLKKILYIGVGSLFGFMFLIILLGLLLSPFRNRDKTTEVVLNKTKVINTETQPQKELSETEKELLRLETEIKELVFPESLLNIPNLEMNIKI